MLHAHLQRPKVELYRYLADDGEEMNQMNARAAIVAVSLATFGTASMSGAQQTGSNEDEATIRKVIVEMTDGFNNHDGKAAARMYAPDARFVSVRGDMMNGQAGIEKGLSAILTTRAKNAMQRTIDVTVRGRRSGRLGAPRDHTSPERLQPPAGAARAYKFPEATSFLKRRERSPAPSPSCVLTDQAMFLDNYRIARRA